MSGYESISSDEEDYASKTLSNNPRKWLRIKEIDSKAQVIRKLNGWYGAMQVSLPNGKTILWKKGTSNDNLREASGSRFTSYLTEGLVPLAKLGKFHEDEGIYENFLDFDHSGFLKQAEKDVEDFSFLDDDQRHQFFCHLLADRLASNWDSHQGQYGIRVSTGKVYSYDKSHAFRNLDLDRKEPTLIYHERINDLDLDKNCWFSPEILAKKDTEGNRLYVPIAPAFAKEILIKKNIDPNHPTVTRFFKRCETIEMSLLEEFLRPLAELQYPQRENEFLEFILNRTQSVKSKVYAFFDWPLPASIGVVE